MAEQRVEKKRDKGQERLLLFLFALSIIIMTMVADQSLGSSAAEENKHIQTATPVPAAVEHMEWQRE